MKFFSPVGMAVWYDTMTHDERLEAIGKKAEMLVIAECEKMWKDLTLAGEPIQEFRPIIFTHMLEIFTGGLYLGSRILESSGEAKEDNS